MKEKKHTHKILNHTKKTDKKLNTPPPNKKNIKKQLKNPNKQKSKEKKKPKETKQTNILSCDLKVHAYINIDLDVIIYVML